MLKFVQMISKVYFAFLFTLTLRRPNLLWVQGPVSLDLAKMVEVKSDLSENLTDIFGGAKNGKFSLKFPNIFVKLPGIDFFSFEFH